MEKTGIKQQVIPDRQIETGSGKEPETVRNFEKITYAAVF